MTLRIFLTAFLFLFEACDRVSVHDNESAIAIANQFLKHDISARYQNAYDLFDDEFRSKVAFDDYRNSGLNNNHEIGKLKRATFQYAMLVGAQEYLELIYSCDFEKITNVPLHFILSGTKRKGYKITVLDIGYNYHSFGDDESKRPKIPSSETHVVTAL